MNDYGNTVAHSAAYAGRLPKDFDRWELRAADLSTVAHAAAFAGKLPERFSAWHLRDGFGETVARLALRHGRMGSEYATRYAAYQAARLADAIEVERRDKKGMVGKASKAACISPCKSAIARDSGP